MREWGHQRGSSQGPSLPALHLLHSSSSPTDVASRTTHIPSSSSSCRRDGRAAAAAVRAPPANCFSPTDTSLQTAIIPPTATVAPLTPPATTSAHPPPSNLRAEGRKPGPATPTNWASRHPLLHVPGPFFPPPPVRLLPDPVVCSRDHMSHTSVRVAVFSPGDSIVLVSLLHRKAPLVVKRPLGTVPDVTHAAPSCCAPESRRLIPESDSVCPPLP